MYCIIEMQALGSEASVNIQYCVNVCVHLQYSENRNTPLVQCTENRSNIYNSRDCTSSFDVHTVRALPRIATKIATKRDTTLVLFRPNTVLERFLM